MTLAPVLCRAVENIYMTRYLFFKPVRPWWQDAPNDALKSIPKATAASSNHTKPAYNDTSISPADTTSGSPNSDARISEIYRKSSLEDTYGGAEEGFSRTSSTSMYSGGVPTSEDGSVLHLNVGGTPNEFAIVPHGKRQSGTSVSACVRICTHQYT